jgi:hypothetical protein
MIEGPTERGKVTLHVKILELILVLLCAGGNNIKKLGR